MRCRFKVIKVFSKIHGCIYRVSRGRIGKRFGGNMVFLLLTTTGRKSGKKRTVPLTAISNGATYILVASFGGNDNHPAWLMNIQRNSAVQIRVGSVVKQANASIIETADAEYEEMWAKAIATYRGYENYKRATRRNIPVVNITPFEV